jgi:hypothetical protein
VLASRDRREPDAVALHLVSGQCSVYRSVRARVQFLRRPGTQPCRLRRQPPVNVTGAEITQLAGAQPGHLDIIRTLAPAAVPAPRGPRARWPAGDEGPGARGSPAPGPPARPAKQPGPRPTRAPILCDSQADGLGSHAWEPPSRTTPNGAGSTRATWAPAAGYERARTNPERSWGSTDQMADCGVPTASNALAGESARLAAALPARRPRPRVACSGQHGAKRYRPASDAAQPVSVTCVSIRANMWGCRRTSAHSIPTVTRASGEAGRP